MLQRMTTLATQAANGTCNSIACANVQSEINALTAAESQIRDTDMADEITAFTKNNILLQASQSMLSQSNSVPQSVLSLIQ